ncbi:MAG: AraC family transcriptional regulator [Proteobacteria bacterium]|nr:MAG: AraC family transcriptional regulator [Pseudomonadota bacterium]
MRATTEYARFFRADDIAPLDCLDARYRRQVFAPHFHESYVVNTLLAGAQRYRYRGAEHVAGRGALVMINPGEMHTGHAETAGGWAYRGFYPSTALIGRLAEAISGRPGAMPLFTATVAPDADLAQRLDRLHLLLAESTDPLVRESAQVAVFGDVIRRHMHIAERPEARCARLTDTVKALLAERLADNISLTELAALTGRSTWHVCRQFRADTGLSPVAWRNQLRVQRALGALVRGEAIGEVATRLGFADQAHLTRAFRAALGVTPGMVRRGQLKH